MTIALIAIPHEHHPKIFWFDDRDDVIAFAMDLNEILLSDCLPHFHRAIRLLSRTWRGYILIESAAKLHKVRKYEGHQTKPVRGLLRELEEKFLPAKPSTDHT